jgi:hypothetical protein
MTYDGKIAIMDQDVAAAGVGIRTMFPSLRHIVFARSPDDAARLSSHFRERFAIELERDYFAARIGREAGVILLSFIDKQGRVSTSANVVQVSGLAQAKSEIPEIAALTRPVPAGHSGSRR